MIDRRRVLQGLTGGALVGTFGKSSVVMASARKQGPPSGAGKKPNVVGPISGGKYGTPFFAFVGDLAALGYIEEEYFLEGEAVSYSPTGPLGEDGRWKVEPAGRGAYKTRILVRRPRDPRRFNGTVLVEWTNVSAGFEIISCERSGIYDGGYAFAAVSAQRIGIHGFDTGSGAGLVQWDPQRYGSLSQPRDSLSYDIYSQAARALRDPAACTGADPLGGLKVRKLIAVGASQSGARVLSYANGIQPLSAAFDAIMPVVTGGRGSKFDDQLFDPRTFASLSPEERQQLGGIQTRIRDDLAIPVMIVNSECETLGFLPSRRPETERYRMWEIAGASHAPKKVTERTLAHLSRDFDKAGMTDRYTSMIIPNEFASWVEWIPELGAATDHVNRWIEGGAPPPIQPPILVEDGKIVRDHFGNAVGGVRLPELEVPIATYFGGGVPGSSLTMESLAGSTKPFTAARLKQLYPTHDDYVAKVTATARAARAAGVIPDSRVQSYIEEARAAKIPA